MKKIFISMGLFFVLIACKVDIDDNIDGNGVIVTAEMGLEYFNSIVIGEAYQSTDIKYSVIKADHRSLKITCDENILQLVNIEYKNNTIKIFLEDSIRLINGDISLEISTPSFSKIITSYTENGSIAGFSEFKDLYLDLNGGHIKLPTDISINGLLDIRMAGMITGVSKIVSNKLLLETTNSLFTNLIYIESITCLESATINSLNKKINIDTLSSGGNIIINGDIYSEKIHSDKNIEISNTVETNINSLDSGGTLYISGSLRCNKIITPNLNLTTDELITINSISSEEINLNYVNNGNFILQDDLVYKRISISMNNNESRVIDTINCDSFTVDLSYASSLELKELKTTDLEMKINYSSIILLPELTNIENTTIALLDSDLSLEGTCDNLNIVMNTTDYYDSFNGYKYFSGSNLTVKKANITLDYNSNIELNILDEISINLSANSILKYYGSPTILSMEINGDETTIINSGSKQ